MRSLGGAIIVAAGMYALVAAATGNGRGLEMVFLGTVGVIVAAIGLVGWIFGEPTPPESKP